MNPENQGALGTTRTERTVMIVVIIVLLMGLAGLSAPLLLKSRKASDRTEALNNIKQVGMMLFEFDNEYGNFPDDETAKEVRRKTKTDFKLTGQYSNDYFRQMLVGGGGKSEKPFWCKTRQSPKKADDNFSNADRMLQAGEVGFSYIMASPTAGQSSSGEPNRPVIVAPSYKFQPDWTFDPKMGAGKAVVLRLDNSATPMQIREDNRKIATNSGKTLGDSGEGTPWGTAMTPFLRAPQADPNSEDPGASEMTPTKVMVVAALGLAAIIMTAFFSRKPKVNTSP